MTGRLSLRVYARTVVVLIGLLAAVSLLDASKDQGEAESGGPGMKEMQREAIEGAMKRHSDRLLSLPGVVGIAIGECDGKPCIKIFIAKKTPGLLKEIPSTLEGFPVSIEETGEFRALDPKLKR